MRVEWPRRGLLGVALLLSACSQQPISDGPDSGASLPPPNVPRVEPRPIIEPLSPIGNHSPYRVAGDTYRVLARSEGYSEKGLASWYGPKFHGKLTSNQEVYDMYAFSAAHKTLPLPSYARVTNLGNQRTVIVRINDRGPFVGDRIIDLSYAAAQKLDMIDAGVAEVEVTTLLPQDGVDLARPDVVSATFVYLQVGAFSMRDNALRLVRQLKQAGIESAQVLSGELSPGQPIHRVQIGPLESESVADQLSEQIVAMGLNQPKVVFQ